MNITFENKPKYRLVWFSKVTGEYMYGKYLFDQPEQARDTGHALKESFPEFDSWLEDRQQKRVEIPH